MIGLNFERAPTSVVCLGAHPDDIEVGAAGLLASFAASSPDTRFVFAIASGDSLRREEAIESAKGLLGDRVSLEFGGLTDGMLPYSQPAETKAFIRATAQTLGDIDLVLAPRREDRHQDHRLVGDLAHQIFRSQMILEYEIVKLEGDLGPVGAYHPMTSAAVESKLDHLMSHFPSQQGKPWYDRNAFAALMRIRGIECHAIDGYAEAFHADRMSIS